MIAPDYLTGISRGEQLTFSAASFFPLKGECTSAAVFTFESDFYAKKTQYD